MQVKCAWIFKLEFEGKYELLIIRNKYLKTSLQTIDKIMNTAQSLFSKSLSKELGYPEDTNKNTTPVIKNNKTKQNQKQTEAINQPEQTVEAKKEKKDQNLKGVFKKIASQIHPDKLQNLAEFEREYKKSLFEKARMALETNDYYGIVEVAEELGIDPPPPNRDQIELMKKTNKDLDKSKGIPA